MSNKYVDEASVKKKKPTKEGKFSKGLRFVLSGEALSHDQVVKNLPFLFNVTAVLVVYIGWGYFGSKTGREIRQLEAELEELNTIEVTEKRKYNLLSRQSQIADSTAFLGLGEYPQGIYKIEVKAEK